MRESEREKSDHMAVTCFHTNYFSKSDNLIKVHAPRHRNSFLCAQQGVFTHKPNANSYLLKNERWPAVEDIVEENKELHGALKKYSLPTSEADNLLRILYDHGISPHQLMPTLDNISKSYPYEKSIERINGNN